MRLTDCGTETHEAQKEIALEIDQSNSCHTRPRVQPQKHSFTEKIVILGIEATEWNSTAADENDESRRANSQDMSRQSRSSTSTRERGKPFGL